MINFMKNNYIYLVNKRIKTIYGDFDSYLTNKIDFDNQLEFNYQKIFLDPTLILKTTNDKIINYMGKDIYIECGTQGI